jgi:hypothetical protein
MEHFNVYNYDHLPNGNPEIIIDALAVVIGDYEVLRKKAALLLLKYLLRKDFYEALMNDYDLYPYDRNDKRVAAWKREVLKNKKCEQCGSEEKLEAHHIIGWAEFPRGRIDVKNGMCLCHGCHTDAHYGERSYSMMKAKK